VASSKVAAVAAAPICMLLDNCCYQHVAALASYTIWRFRDVAAHRCTCPLPVLLLLQWSSPQGKTGRRWRSCRQCARKQRGTGPWGTHAPHSAPRRSQGAPGTLRSCLCGVRCSWVVPAGLTGRAGRLAAGCRRESSCCQCTQQPAGPLKRAGRNPPWQLQTEQQ
jgi:hypothetical protein